MAKKANFPLKMREAKVRSLEELRENFDLESVLAYYDNGRLVDWLKLEYYHDEAEKITALDKTSPDFKKQLCEILGAEYSEYIADNVSLSNISVRNERLERLKQYTYDDKILAAVDSVAFSQEDLEHLCDLHIQELNRCISRPIFVDTFYLCGEKFRIPDKYLPEEKFTPPHLNYPKSALVSGRSESEFTPRESAQKEEKLTTLLYNSTPSLKFFGINKPNSTTNNKINLNLSFLFS